MHEGQVLSKFYAPGKKEDHSDPYLLFIQWHFLGLFDKINNIDLDSYVIVSLGILYLSFHSMLQDIIPPEETQTTAAPPTVSTTPPVLAVTSAHTAPPPEHDPGMAFIEKFNDLFTEVKKWL